MADSTLNAIRNKVRRLTKSPSESILSTPDLDEYVNTFVLYDFPEHLRLFALHTTFTFYLTPNVDKYSTNTTNVNSPLYNFKNKYISVSNPVYVAGYKSLFSQSPEQFYNIYPFLNTIANQTQGDGVTTQFTGTLSAVPVIQNKVIFTAVDANNNAMTMIDIPINSLQGNLYLQDGPIASDTVLDVNNNINYLTGAYTVTFPNAVAAAANVTSETVPYVAAQPQSMLYYDETFVFRPIPDQAYVVNMLAYIRPTELLSSGQSPELEEWWQYIAYGAAKKILEDRIDMDTVALILPEYKKQELLVLRPTLVQQASERTATIYTEQTSVLSGPWGWNNNNN